MVTSWTACVVPCLTCNIRLQKANDQLVVLCCMCTQELLLCAVRLVWILLCLHMRQPTTSRSKHFQLHILSVAGEHDSSGSHMTQVGVTWFKWVSCIYRTAVGLCCAMGWPCCLPCSQSAEGYPPLSPWTRWWSPSFSSSLSSVSTGLSSFPILPMASFICFHRLGVSVPHDCHVTGPWLSCDWSMAVMWLVHDCHVTGPWLSCDCHVTDICVRKNLGWFSNGYYWRQHSIKRQQYIRLFPPIAFSLISISTWLKFWYFIF